jgi:hypothetical protein
MAEVHPRHKANFRVLDPSDLLAELSALACSASPEPLGH